MLFIIYIFPVLLNFEVNAQTKNYCAPTLCPERQHVACAGRHSFAPYCPISSRQINETNYMNIILDEHNKLRSQIALGRDTSGVESAARMGTMRWDKELANLALIQARKCLTQKDACRNTEKFQNVGQNFYTTTRISPNYNFRFLIQEAMNTWSSGLNSFGNEIFIEDPDNILTDNLTSAVQLIVDKATAIGCGIVDYVVRRHMQINIYCNYNSAPRNGSLIYIEGNTTSQCTRGPNRKYPGLCALNENINPNHAT